MLDNENLRFQLLQKHQIQRPRNHTNLILIIVGIGIGECINPQAEDKSMTNQVKISFTWELVNTYLQRLYYTSFC